MEATNIVAINLKTEYTTNPLGIDETAPRLSWQVKQEKRGAKQTAYRVIVSTDKEKVEQGIGTVWDTGKVPSDDTFNIVYNGVPLSSGTCYYWAVKLWDKDGNEGAFSEIATFETALLNETDWQGVWIGMGSTGGGPAQIFRREFVLDKPIAKARAYVTGLGYYELYINGEKQGDHLLDPAFTNYKIRVFYATYDVTKALTTGDNCVAIMVGDGWYKNPSCIMQLNITYTDGTQTSVYTEPNKWDMVFAPITRNDIYVGEQYDSRFEVVNFSKPSPDFYERFPRQHWKVYAGFYPWPGHPESDEYQNVYRRSFKAMWVPAPGGKLQAQPLEPIKLMKELKPVSIKQPKEGVWVIDFGQNIAGWVRFKVQGPEGQLIVLRYSEILHPDGTINQDHLKAAENYGSPLPMQTDVYRLSGIGVEEFDCHFTYHGFRYVQVEGLPYAPLPDDFIACVVRSSVAQIGYFECGNDLINRIQRNILWGESTNLHGIPTDCPQRDERMGWLNDMTARYEAALYNFHMVRLYEKWAQDISDAQDPVCGSIPDTAPRKRGHSPADPCTSSYLLIAKGLYDHYGDLRVVEKRYEGMKKWTEYLWVHQENGILGYSYWGDWAGPKDYTTRQMCDAISKVTPGELISTGYLYYDLKLMSEFATLLGKADEAKDFADRAKFVKDSFNRLFFNPETNQYGTGSQGCNVFPLYLGIVPTDRVAAVAKNLADDVIAHDYHLTTGNLCTKYLMEMLCEYGYTDVAYKLATQTTYPSWGYMIENGATTIWERWENATGQGMNSHNHPMYGSVSAYFYKYLVGIRPLDEYPGYERFMVKPFIPTDLPYAKATLHTIRGEVFVSWEKKGAALEVTIKVPGNSEAQVYLPMPGFSKVEESGAVLWDNGPTSAAEGICIKGLENGYLSMLVGSGEYTFIIE